MLDCIAVTLGVTSALGSDLVTWNDMAKSPNNSRWCSVVTTHSNSPDVAEVELRAAVARAVAEAGEADPITFKAISELASHLRQRGQLVEAESLMRKALDGRRTRLGEDHHDTLLSMNNLAGLLRVQGRFGEAEQLLLAVLAARQRTPNAGRAELLTAKNNLASLWFDQDRF
jgi:Flp pilus assembly protein TadD